METLKDHPVVQFYVNNNHFGKLLGMDFEVRGPGKVDYKMEVKEEHLATPIACHGGAVCSLMDATMGVSALSEVIMEGKVISTIEMKISFITPASKGDVILGKAKVIKRGNRLIFVEGEIRNQDDELIATASGTFNAYPAEKAGFV